MSIARQISQMGLQALMNPYYGQMDAPTPREQMLIDELRSGCEAISTATPIQESKAAHLWAQFQQTVMERILTSDPRTFLSWDVITRTMFVPFSFYAAQELASLRRREDWSTRWKAALCESIVGRPAPFLFYPKTSANLIHDAYSVCSFEVATKTSIGDFQRVVEFGGGYGSMCRLFFNLGFQGTYIIYDLPLFSRLQSYFLKSLGIPVSGASVDARRKYSVLISQETDLDLHMRAHDGKKSLFIAAWSLSETPVDTRKSFLSRVEGFDAFLIAFQAQFSGVDNIRFFKQWQEGTSESIDWRMVPIPQIRGKHFYLFGTRRVL